MASELPSNGGDQSTFNFSPLFCLSGNERYLHMKNAVNLITQKSKSKDII